MFNSPRKLVLIGLVGLFSSVHAAWADPPTEFAYSYREIAAPAPSASCPGMLKFTQAGEGVDLGHGPFTVRQTYCADLSAWPPVAVIHDATLVLTFFDGSTLTYVIDEAAQVLDTSNCLLRQEENKVHGVITGGTGRFEGAEGTIRGVFGRAACFNANGFIWGVSHVENGN